MIVAQNVHKGRLSYTVIICLFCILLAVQVYTILRIRALQAPPAQNTGVFVLTPRDRSPTTQSQGSDVHVARRKIDTFDAGESFSVPFEWSWEGKVYLDTQTGQDTLPSEPELGWIIFRLKGLQRLVDANER